MQFTEFFEAATGFGPYPYQCRLAEMGLPDVITAPTGSGKTEAVVVPWLWRSFHASGQTRAETPRRLVIALPMRTLVEQSERRIAAMIARLGLGDSVRLQVLMGGRLGRDRTNSWRMAPHERSVVVGTVDAVVSRMLNRGYGSTRAAYPIDFALVANGAQIVVDEVQLCVQAAATLRQVNAFQADWQTFEPVGLTCMSATILPEALDVVDNHFDPATASIVGLSQDDEHHPALAKRLEAVKTVRELTGCDKPKDIGQAVREVHTPGTLTLVIVNTVKRAVEVYQSLKKGAEADLVLLHSQFRGVERADILERVLSEVPAGGRIIVSTQTLEAGVDLDARTLVTEAAPWSSLVQRAGRANRTGEQLGASLLWFDAWKEGPYCDDDTKATAAALRDLENQCVAGRDLLALEVAQNREDLSIIRRGEMASLFETAADQAGRDIDISRYIRGDDKLDVQVAWVDTSLYLNGTDVATPPEPLRCAVRPNDLRSFLSRDPRPRVLTFSTTDDRWIALSNAGQVKPQQVLLVDCADGGYDPELGFLASSRLRVDPRESAPGAVPDAEGVGSDAGVLAGTWLPLRTHLDQTREQAAAMVRAIGCTTPIDDAAAAAMIGAAALHDIGKAHPYWQSALLGTALDHPHTGLFAKSPNGRADAPWVLKDDAGQPRPNFRHELVSALMLLTPDGERAMADSGVPECAFDLCRYLVAAHHGHVRINPQDPTIEGRSGRLLFGLRQGDAIPGLVGEGSLADLDAVFRGGPGSWTDRSLSLLERWGPFRLAYAEMLVRMADWRASALVQAEATL